MTPLVAHARTNTSTPEMSGRTIGETNARVGADLVSGPVSMVVFPRKDKPPLRFKGARLTHHWMCLSREITIEIELWRQGTKGFVIVYSVLDACKLGSRVIQVSNLAEAADCLENICANLDATMIQPLAMQIAWADLHLHLCFKQQFAQLVADVLADWYVLPHLQEAIQ